MAPGASALNGDERDRRGEALIGNADDAERRLRSLGRMVRNGMSVLAAILIAFGLDAWWTDRDEAERLGDLLLLIAEEFEAATVQIDSIVSANDSEVAKGIAFLARTEPGLPPLSRDSVAQFSGFGEIFQTYNPEFGALNTLIASGGLEGVRDLGLQQALGGWDGELLDHDFERQLLTGTVRKVLDTWSAAGVTSTLVLQRASGSDDDSEIWLQLANDEAFRQTVAELAILLTSYRAELMETRDRAAELASRLGG
jgi:hypothetical protein